LRGRGIGQHQRPALVVLNYGSWIDVWPRAGRGRPASASYTPTYGSGSGTSFAAPFTAGAVALYQGYRRSLAFRSTSRANAAAPHAIRTDDIDALNGTYGSSVGSRLNVYRLLTDPPASWTGHRRQRDHDHPGAVRSRWRRQRGCGRRGE
jgi:hypothetical protein